MRRPSYIISSCFPSFSSHPLSSFFRISHGPHPTVCIPLASRTVSLRYKIPYTVSAVLSDSKMSGSPIRFTPTNAGGRNPASAPTEKYCSHCQRDKPAGDFGKPGTDEILKTCYGCRQGRAANRVREGGKRRRMPLASEVFFILDSTLRYH